MRGILNSKEINIAIAGKALRGRMETYILNVINTVTARVIAQLAIMEKENEVATM